MGRPAQKSCSIEQRERSCYTWLPANLLALVKQSCGASAVQHTCAVVSVGTCIWVLPFPSRQRPCLCYSCSARHLHVLLAYMLGAGKCLRSLCDFAAIVVCLQITHEAGQVSGSACMRCWEGSQQPVGKPPLADGKAPNGHWDGPQDEGKQDCKDSTS